MVARLDRRSTRHPASKKGWGNVVRFFHMAGALLLATSPSTVFGGEADPVEKVRQLLSVGKRKEALQTLGEAIASRSKAVEDDPDNPLALYELARVLYERRRDPVAKTTLEKALAITPDDPDLISFRGLMHHHDDESAEAEEKFKLAVQKSGGKSKYRYELARFYWACKRTEEAKSTLGKVIEDDPKWSMARIDLAAILFETGDRQAAIELAEEGLRLNEEDVELRDSLGQMLQIADRSREAYDVYCQVIDRDPKHFRAASKLVQLASQLGLATEREAHLERIRNIYSEGDAPIEYFCREQFVVGDRRVFAFEYFRPRGERMIFYRFDVSNKTGETVILRLSLGSYDATTQVARETKQIGPDERMYHIDGHVGREHSTYDLIPKNLPSYDETRKIVVEILDGSREPISRSN
jgi:tetratricopeptide (TPR) repeat protein